MKSVTVIVRGLASILCCAGVVGVGAVGLVGCERESGTQTTTTKTTTTPDGGKRTTETTERTTDTPPRR